MKPNVMKNLDLKEKRKYLYKYKNIFLVIKINNNDTYQWNKEKHQINIEHCLMKTNKIKQNKKRIRK